MIAHYPRKRIGIFVGIGVFAVHSAKLIGIVVSELVGVGIVAAGIYKSVCQFFRGTVSLSFAGSYKHSRHACRDSYRFRSGIVIDKQFANKVFRPTAAIKHIAAGKNTNKLAVIEIQSDIRIGFDLTVIGICEVGVAEQSFTDIRHYIRIAADFEIVIGCVKCKLGAVQIARQRRRHNEIIAHVCSAFRRKTKQILVVIVVSLVVVLAAPQRVTYVAVGESIVESIRRFVVLIKSVYVTRRTVFRSGTEYAVVIERCCEGAYRSVIVAYFGVECLEIGVYKRGESVYKIGLSIRLGIPSNIGTVGIVFVDLGIYASVVSPTLLRSILCV